jgi:hypothetical protein
VRFEGRYYRLDGGPPAAWADQLTALVLEHGMSAFILGPGRDAATDLRRFAEEVAPAVREAVAHARAGAVDSPERPQPGSATLPHRGPAPGPGSVEAAPADVAGSVGAQTLVAVHEHLRRELDQLREILGQVAAGRAGAERARSHLRQMTVRQNYWTFGAFCAAYCRVVTVHHAIEDAHRAVDRLADALLPHLQVEEDQLLDPIARLGIQV